MVDISSIIQIIALGGFLLGFAGIGLVVLSASQGRPIRNGVLLAVVGLIAGVLLTIVGQGILVVPPTRSAVIVDVLDGSLEQPARGPGTSIVVPVLQQAIIYPTDEQEYTMSGTSEEGRIQGDDSVEALTEDGQRILMDITVLYRIDREDVNTVHLKWQNRYETQFIRPQVRAIARDATAGFSAVSIYGSGREDLQNEIEARLSTVMEEDGLTLSSLLVRTIRFGDDFAESIERKEIAEQELERARTDAERARTEAEGLANAEIEKARGDAEARLIEASAEAEALRLISDQIAANPNLIPYTYVQRLSDNVNMVLLPSETPFLFDAESFTDLGSDFVAPPVPEPNIDEVTNPDLDLGGEDDSESDN